MAGARFGSERCIALALAAAAAVTVLACAGRAPARVSPQEIPDLEARLAGEPSNTALLGRYAEALFAATRCDTAQVVARRLLATNPADAVATLIVGQCQERAGQYDDAIALYDRYASQNAGSRQVGAVRGRALLARRDHSTAQARAALRREQELAQQPGDPQTVAVLPLQIVGDSSYQSLSRGLAQMMISDLALLQRFRMVERLQLGAVLDEIRFAQGDRVDPTTAARVGRLVQAGRLVQGLATIPRDGPVRLEASVVQQTGEVSGAEQVDGRLRELLQLEKDLVIALAGRLGYTLSEAERQAVLENGTRNVQALLAYSRGLLSEDAGDYARAALYYSEAVQADPNFQVAREQQQAAAAAPALQQAAASGNVTGAVAQTGAQQPAPAQAPASSALNNGVADMAGTTSEKNTASSAQNTGQQAANTQAAQPNTTTTQTGTTQTATGTVTIIFRLP
ncbi:MAG: hypothetical protein HY560_07230 [Gemmatimonadetes bacterium]|nr:hypothetical protein [Gemmatimonadota bacterium]